MKYSFHYSLLLSLTLIMQNFTQAQNINLSNSPYFNGECYLAVNPINPEHLVTAWMHFTLSNLKNAMATRSSFDGGKTWSPLQTLPHVYPKFTVADPSIYFGKDSCVYLAYIDLSGLTQSDSGYDMIVRSVNGGITWNMPVKANSWKAQPNLPIDRPWIAADGSNGPYSGRVYLTTMNAYFTPPPHYPWFTYSADSGTTWMPIKRLDDSIPCGTINEPAAFTTISANGTFYAAYPSYFTKYSPYARTILCKSFDGGASFIPYIVANYTAADVVPDNDSLLHVGYSLASNPSDTSNLILAQTDNHFGEPDIVSYYSNDAGKTWSGPVRLNDDPTGKGICHDMVWGSFANNGVYAVAWRDRRNTGKGDSVPFQIYATTSRTEGASFTPNFLISDTISPPVYLERGDDFLGCAVTDSNVFADWSDMRTGNENTFFNATSFSKIPLVVFSVSDNPSVKVEAYPNPFHNETNIVIYSAIPLNQCLLKISTIDGKNVGEIRIPGSGNYKLNFTSLNSGTYIWSLIAGDKRLARGKWVIQ